MWNCVRGSSDMCCCNVLWVDIFHLHCKLLVLYIIHRHWLMCSVLVSTDEMKCTIISIAQIIKSVSVSVSESVSLSHRTSWTLYRSQSSTDLHQTCHQGRVPGGVVTYCFRWKSEIFLPTKPEVELILTIAPMEKYLCQMSQKMVSLWCWDTMEVREETTSGLSIATITFDPGWPWTVLVQGAEIACQILQKQCTRYSSIEQIDVA